MRTTDFKHGDLVTYIPGHAFRDKEHPDCENGVVSSINNVFVFVKYDTSGRAMVTGDEDYMAEATSPGDLIRR